jgi:hypothetical protein
MPKSRIIGFVTRIEGSWVTIGEVTVECDANTKFFGNPVIGSKAEAVVAIRPNGSVVGLEIHIIGASEPTPSPWEFTGIVEAINGEWWSISGTNVKVMGGTVLEENPVVGNTVTVKAQVDGSEIWALRISALRGPEVNFRGTIEAMDGDGWVIDGYRVIVDGSTLVEGGPQIGSLVDVVAVQKPDGRIVAKRIVAVTIQETP